MTLLKASKVTRRQIDLNGPDGNAFCLLGLTRQWGKELGWTKAESDANIKDMMAGSYKELVEEFEAHFGTFCDIILPNNWS